MGKCQIQYYRAPQEGTYAGWSLLVDKVGLIAPPLGDEKDPAELIEDTAADSATVAADKSSDDDAADLFD
jgi:hypothetical protein